MLRDQITTHQDLMQWARSKMVQTFSDFYKEDADPDELIV